MLPANYRKLVMPLTELQKTAYFFENYIKYNPHYKKNGKIKKKLQIIWAEGQEYKDWYLYLCKTMSPPVTEEDEKEADKMLGNTFICLKDGRPEFVILVYDGEIPEVVKKLSFYHEITHVLDYPERAAREIEKFDFDNLTDQQNIILDGIWFWTEFLSEYKSYDTVLKEYGRLFLLEDVKTAEKRIEKAELPEACAILCLLENKKHTIPIFEAEELACAFSKKGCYFPELLDFIYKCGKMMAKYKSNPEDIEIREIEWIGKKYCEMENGQY